MTVRNKYRPDLSCHPGPVVREMLRSRGLTQRAFAEQLGIADSYLSDVLQGKRGVSVRLALRLEKELEVAAEFWLQMQMNHDLATAREEA